MPVLELELGPPPPPSPGGHFAAVTAVKTLIPSLVEVAITRPGWLKCHTLHFIYRKTDIGVRGKLAGHICIFCYWLIPGNEFITVTFKCPYYGGFHGVGFDCSKHTCTLTHMYCTYM